MDEAKKYTTFLKKVFFLGASVKIFEACFEAVVSQNNPKIYCENKDGNVKSYVTFLSMSFSNRNHSDYTKELVAKF